VSAQQKTLFNIAGRSCGRNEANSGRKKTGPQR